MLKRLSLMDFEPAERSGFEDESKRRRLVTIGRRSYRFDGGMEYGNRDCHILIGRYSSLGHRIVFEMGLNHDHGCISTYPFGDRPKNAE